MRSQAPAVLSLVMAAGDQSSCDTAISLFYADVTIGVNAGVQRGMAEPYLSNDQAMDDAVQSQLPAVPRSLVSLLMLRHQSPQKWPSFRNWTERRRSESAL